MIRGTSTKFLLATILVFAGFLSAEAQISDSDNQSHSNYAAISTSFPFLRVTPDARAAAMGEAGVARIPDVNNLSINPSAIVFLPAKAGVGLSYNPWLQNVTKNMSLSYVSAYINSGQQALGMSVRYFSLGESTFRDEHALLLGIVHPVEYALDISYARKLGPDFSLGATVRYAQSRLSLNDQGTGLRSAGAAVAVDISAYLVKPGRLFGYEAEFAGGVNLSNIGPASLENHTGQQHQLPANLKIGSSAAIAIDDVSHLAVTADLNKLLVSERQIEVDGQQGGTFPASIWRSFSDSDFQGELAGISCSLGLEYTFKQVFSLRSGYMHANSAHGNGSHLSLGLGLKYYNVNIDLAYLPVNIEKSPVANTLKIGLIVNFGRIEHKRDGLIRP
jgi:hypothetical protein